MHPLGNAEEVLSAKPSIDNFCSYKKVVPVSGTSCGCTYIIEELESYETGVILISLPVMGEWRTLILGSHVLYSTFCQGSFSQGKSCFLEGLLM